jgi:hypothetical protein
VSLPQSRDILTDHRDRIAFSADNPRDRSTKGALARDNHNLTVAVLAALLPAIGKPVGGSKCGIDCRWRGSHRLIESRVTVPRKI